MTGLVKKAARDQNLPMKLLACFVLGFGIVLAHGGELPECRNQFVVIAHRANHTRAHENTLTALQRAIDAGVDYAEIDVRRTADDQYVLMHDATVDRMTDGHGAVRKLTLAQIRALVVRDKKRPQIPPDRIPTFAEVLALVKGRLNIYLDFKEGDRAVVAKAIQDAGLERQVLVYDDVESVAEWRRVAPELPLIVSPPGNIKTPDSLLEWIRMQKVEVLDGDWDGYSPEMVQAASRAGVKVWPDIQSGKETEAYFKRVMARGFTGVQTDHPEDLIAWLKTEKLR
jgi:glycerophosphoryl diester phosphodiesterase